MPVLPAAGEAAFVRPAPDATDNAEARGASHEAVRPALRPLVGADWRGHLLAGVKPRRVGLVWIDAHADFNTPETTLSGMLGGMPVAIASGLCLTRHRLVTGLDPALPTKFIVMAGLRDVDPLEQDLLDRSDCEMLTADDIRRLTPSLDHACGDRADGLTESFLLSWTRIGWYAPPQAITDNEASAPFPGVLRTDTGDRPASRKVAVCVAPGPPALGLPPWRDVTLPVTAVTAATAASQHASSAGPV